MAFVLTYCLDERFKLLSLLMLQQRAMPAQQLVSRKPGSEVCHNNLQIAVAKSVLGKASTISVCAVYSSQHHE